MAKIAFFTETRIYYICMNNVISTYEKHIILPRGSHMDS